MVVVPAAPAIAFAVVVVVGLLPRCRLDGSGGGGVLSPLSPPLPSWWWVHCRLCGDGGGTAAPAAIVLLVELKTTQCTLSRLAEFQILMIFDRCCYFNHNTFYRTPKIVQIIIYTCWIDRNMCHFFRG